MIYAIIIISLILILQFLLILDLYKKLGVKCKHLWKKHSETQQICTKCGEISNIGCDHNWEKESTVDIYSTNLRKDKVITGSETIYICKKCTKRKYVRLSLSEDPVVKIF